MTISADESLWLAGGNGAEHPSLREEITADVVVIGGGIAGVTTALRLQREGVQVVLLEAFAIGSGVTGNTSAKVSALQGTTLSRIVARHGSEVAEITARRCGRVGPASAVRSSVAHASPRARRGGPAYACSTVRNRGVALLRSFPSATDFISISALQLFCSAAK